MPVEAKLALRAAETEPQEQSERPADMPLTRRKLESELAVDRGAIAATRMCRLGVAPGLVIRRRQTSSSRPRSAGGGAGWRIDTLPGPIRREQFASDQRHIGRPL